MSVLRRTFRQDLELGIQAYLMCNTNVRPRLVGNPAGQWRLVQLVRRLCASDFDVEDCVTPSDGIGYRREIRCVAVALIKLTAGKSNSLPREMRNEDG